MALNFTIFFRFVFCIPTVWSPGVKISAPHLPGPFLNWERTEEPQIRRELSPKFQILNTISRRQSVRFPEARLIQYDCGKLQTLDPLLRKLKRETHRALIFTQVILSTNLHGGILFFLYNSLKCISS